MDFYICKKALDKTIEFHGSIGCDDIARLRLDALDRALLNNGAENAADSLLILEMLFRRHAEQTGEQIVKGAVLP